MAKKKQNGSGITSGILVLACSLVLILLLLIGAIVFERITRSLDPVDMMWDSCAISETGTNFSMVFMENNESSLSHRLEIYPAYRFNKDVDIQFTWSSDNVSMSNVTTLKLGAPMVVAVPSTLQMNGMETAWKSIKIGSSDKIGVYAMNRHISTCDGFMVLPYSMLGTSHFVVCYFPQDKQTQLSFVTVEDNTTVIVSLRASTRPGLFIRWNDQIYRGGSNITFNLAKDQAVQLKADSDLTGCSVLSDKPIAVFSGNDLTTVSKILPIDDSVNDTLALNYLVEQVPDLRHWGVRFYLAPFALTYNNQSPDYQVKFVCSVANTNVTLYIGNGSSAKTCLKPGDYFVTFISSNESVSIYSNYPILVAQIFGSTYLKGPSMAIITPLEKFNSFYMFSTAYSEPPDTKFTHYVQIISLHNETTDIRLNDQALSEPVVWSRFGDNSTYVWTMMAVKEGLQIMHNLRKMSFGVLVLGESVGNKFCTYAYGAGLCS